MPTGISIILYAISLIFLIISVYRLGHVKGYCDAMKLAIGTLDHYIEEHRKGDKNDTDN